MTGVLLTHLLWLPSALGKKAQPFSLMLEVPVRLATFISPVESETCYAHLDVPPKHVPGALVSAVPLCGECCCILETQFKIPLLWASLPTLPWNTPSPSLHPALTSRSWGGGGGASVSSSDPSSTLLSLLRCLSSGCSDFGEVGRSCDKSRGHWRPPKQ